MANNIAVIEKIIGYTFKDKSLLMRAFTHSSFVNENQNFVDYERLEFVGDALLNYIVAVYLYNTYPTFSEGELSKRRASMVSAHALGKVIESLDILKFVRVGVGTEIMNAKNIKSDLFEAIIGAIVIDNNYDIRPAKDFALKHLNSVEYTRAIDYKSKILEYCAKNSIVAKFDIVSQERRNNITSFVVSLTVDGKFISQGSGSNKKSAEQDASKAFYNQIFTN